MPKHATLAERFWEKVDTSGGPDACWLWTGRREGPTGYGSIGMPGAASRVRRKAHRVAYELVHGVDPGPFCVLHACDNPPCVNPAHLRLGTQKDNAHDRGARNRANAHLRRGTGNGRAKLTMETAAEIRREWATGGWTKRALGRRYGVSDTQIGKVVTGKLWVSE